MDNQFSKLNKKFAQLKKELPLKDLNNHLKDLLIKSQNLNTWQDQSKNIALLQEQKSLQILINNYKTIKKALVDLPELSTLLNENPDPDIELELNKKSQEINKLLVDLLIMTTFKGPYDKNDVLLELRVGQGGIDAQDWTEMLLRMYSKYCAKHNWVFDILDIQYGNGTGIISLIAKIQGLYAFGYLKNERGIHRLVRLSPFNSGNTRETSFASVSIIPQIKSPELAVTINEDDLEMKSYRASGPGGQSTNKNATAVQLIHKPSGINIRCSVYKSQTRNKESAINTIKTKLVAQQAEHEQAKLQKLKGDTLQASWGKQTRNYVLHPYKLIKDLHSGKSTSQVDKVLDGNIDLLFNS